MYNNIAERVLTPECRLSYAFLSTPRKNDIGAGTEKYSVTLLIPKNDDVKADIDAAFEAARQKGKATKWGGKDLHPVSVIHDGDGRNPSGDVYPEECHGCWVITASSTTKPYVCGIDNVKTELLPTDIYSGMYARVTFQFYPYDTAGKKGVACGLRGVMKTRDGEPLSSGTVTSSEFEAFANTQTSEAPKINPITGEPM